MSRGEYGLDSKSKAEQTEEYSVRADNIVNMDEVPLTFNIPMEKTVDSHGVNSVTIKTTGHEKMHFRCALAVTASGKKLPLMLIFKRKTMPKEHFPVVVVVRVTIKGWMDTTMMIDG